MNNNYQRCIRCIMDTSDPDISFNEAGICSHCLKFDRLTLSTVEAADSGQRLPLLSKLIDQAKINGKGKQYDCIVGVSGGVDSSYVLLKSVEFGLRPLAVHFDSGWNSELAVNNIENATNVLGVDLVTDVVNWSEMRDLQLAFLRSGVPNCDIPTDHAFPAIAYKSAVAHGANFILSGSNLATESVLPSAWGHGSGDLRHLKDIHRKFGSVPLKSYPTLGLVKKDLWYPFVRGVKTVKILDYLPYDKSAAKSEIVDKLGWRDYGGKHFESIFTRFFQGQYLPRRFGFDKRLAHESSLILSGQRSREQALSAVSSEPPYPSDLQISDAEFVAKKLGIPHAELQQMMSAAPRDHDEFRTSDRFYAAAFKIRDFLRRS